MSMRVAKAAAIAVGLLMLSGTALSAESKPAKAAKQKPAPAAPAPRLEKGMTAEEVVKLIGKPKEIVPMKVPEGTAVTAETWIYRRDLGTRSTQVASGTREVPGFVGAGIADTGQHRTEIIYTTKIVHIEQVTTLLMYDGKLVLARQSQEVNERY